MATADNLESNCQATSLCRNTHVEAPNHFLLSKTYLDTHSKHIITTLRSPKFLNFKFFNVVLLTHVPYIPHKYSKRLQLTIFKMATT